LTITLVQGGTGINVVPDSCSVSLDRRIVSNEKASEVAAALVQMANEACPLPLTAHIHREIDAFYQPPDTPFVERLAAWSDQSPVVAPYGTNAWAYQRVGCDRVVLGPGSIDQAHGAVEWISVAELAKLSSVYAAWWGLE
jgi:acetylornithine deacetylase